MEPRAARVQQHGYGNYSTAAFSFFVEARNGFAEPIDGCLFYGGAVDGCLYKTALRHRAPGVLPMFVNSFQARATHEVRARCKSGERNAQKIERVKEAAGAAVLRLAIDLKSNATFERILYIEP